MEKYNNCTLEKHSITVKDKKKLYLNLFKLGYMMSIVQFKIGINRDTKDSCDQVKLIISQLDFNYHLIFTTDSKRLNDSIELMFINALSYYRDEMHFIQLGTLLACRHFLGEESKEIASLHSQLDTVLTRCDINRDDLFPSSLAGAANKQIIDYQLGILKIWLLTFSQKKIDDFKKEFSANLTAHTTQKEVVAVANKKDAATSVALSQKNSMFQNSSGCQHDSSMNYQDLCYCNIL